MNAPSSWHRVFVRHLLPNRRSDVTRLSGQVKPTFETSSSGSEGGGDGIWCRPNRRWMIGIGFPKVDWVTLFSNSATAAEIFQRNAGNKRMEVACVGFDESVGGWFFWFHRGGKRVVRFSQGDPKGAEAKLEGDEEAQEIVAKFANGKSAFKGLCQHYGVPARSPEVIAENGKFVVIGVQGKPIKGTHRGLIEYYGQEIAAGENPAADQLEEAIERRDVEAVRAALEAGAPVDVLAESSVSPLLCALYKWETPEGQKMAELLLQHGAKINGREGDDPPLVELNSHMVADHISYEAGKFLLEHGADVNAQNSYGETALHEAVVHLKWASAELLINQGAQPSDELIKWARERIERDLKFYRRSDYAKYLTLLTDEEVELPPTEVLTPELEAENARFTEYFQLSDTLALLEAGIAVRDNKRNTLMQQPEAEAWVSELKNAGFEVAGPVQLVIGFNVRPSFSMVHVDKKMEAIITAAGPQMDQIRVDIGVYHPDGEVTCAGNLPPESFLGMKTPYTHFTLVEDANAKKLVKALGAKVAKSQREVLPVDVKGYLVRYRKHNSRVLEYVKAEIQGRLERPAIFVNGKPARFEKVKCYLDMSSWKDPTYSTRRTTKSFLNDVAKGAKVDPKVDDWTAGRGLRAAYDVAVGKHMQLAGAVETTGYLSPGCETGLKYFQYQTNRSRPFSDNCYIEEMEQALVLTILADDWPKFGELCETMRAKLATPKVRMPDDPPEEEGMILLVIGSTFRAKKIPGGEKLREKIRQSRRKRCHFLLDAWEAIEQENWEAFPKALTAATKKHITRTSKAKTWYEMSMMIAKPESILWAIARRRGMPEIELAEEVADRIITPETISG